MLMEKVVAASQPVLKDKTIKDIVIGISLIGVELSDGTVGVAYVLRDGLPSGCSVFRYVNEIIGKPAAEIADWVLTGDENIKRAIAAAVLSAAANDLELEDEITEMPFGMELDPDTTVGMIGLVRPIANLVKQNCKLIAFDEGLYLHGERDSIYPMSHQPELLPQCDIVILSGTTTINGTIDGLLEMCSNARQIIMFGPSTPMYKEGWQGTGITNLAGATWDNAKKDEIFRMISLGNGVSELGKYMIKKNVLV